MQHLGYDKQYKKYDFQFSDDYDPERYNVLQLADVKVLSMALNLMSKNLSSDVIVERRDSYVDDDKDTMFSNKNPSSKDNLSNIIDLYKGLPKYGVDMNILLINNPVSPE